MISKRKSDINIAVKNQPRQLHMTGFGKILKELKKHFVFSMSFLQIIFS